MKIIAIILSLAPILAYGQAQRLPLYSGKVPNSIPTSIKEESTNNGIVRLANVSVPELWYYPAPGSDPKKCLIICPGGGYNILAIDHEGTEVAKKLNSWGITAFVLKYRIPRDHAQPNKSIAPLQDAQQAIRFLRTNAMDFAIDPNKIGIMGFSAGGHLAATAGTHFGTQVGELADASNVRPNYMVLGYPVITFDSTYGHIGSRNALLGKNPSQEAIDLYSNEKHVSPNTPPTFLMHATDDKTVPVRNSQVFYEALQKNGVATELFIYPTGGHGFGMHNKTENPDAWLDALKLWLDKQ
jgi:acetyl esterase/lipase